MILRNISDPTDSLFRFAGIKRDISVVPLDYLRVNMWYSLILFEKIRIMDIIKRNVLKKKMIFA